MAKVILVDSPAWILNRPKDYFMLGLAYLASGLRRAGHEVKIAFAHEVTSWDGRLVIHPEKMAPCDYLGVYATTPQMKWAQEMTKPWPARFKVLGGPHATYVMSGPYAEDKRPESFAGFDYVLAGECDETLPKLVTEGPKEICGGWRVGESAVTSLNGSGPPARANVARLPVPAFDLLREAIPEIRLRHDGKCPALRFAPVISSRGCPFGCAFCAEARTPVRPLSLAQVEAQLDLLAELGVRAVHFYDDTFNLDQERSKRVAELAAGYGMQWRSALRTNPKLYSKELFHHFREHGCAELEFGVEHASQPILKAMRKGITAQESERAIKTAQDCGLAAYALLMLGFPGETLQTVDELRQWVLRVRPNAVALNMFQAVPGTEVWNHPERFGVKLRRPERGTWCFFLENEMELSIDSPRIKPEELIAAHRKLTEEFHAFNQKEGGC